MEEEVFLKQIKAFNHVTPTEADKLIESGNESILFIGRETCSYCRKFANTLTDVLAETPLKINFLHSQNPETIDQVDAFRQKYNIYTVPGFIYSNNDQLKVRCDSSMTKEEILSFVEVNSYEG
ncbi:thioredoxin domain-containing protein [Fundicoccus culcitae]|uniref:Thioredoxin n=1 Tax=Fundicoccus culcitae TaxID=2969821 RepID=A0ABY5P6U1_9LACT|nr:thioredoxin [Fundicoccus culcitae]UUX34449.1 thioredoxin [Fundicoccus culcitae]